LLDEGEAAAQELIDFFMVQLRRGNGSEATIVIFEHDNTMTHVQKAG